MAPNYPLTPHSFLRVIRDYTDGSSHRSFYFTRDRNRLPISVNESNKTIKLASTTSLGQISFVRNETARMASSSTKITTPHNFEECLKDIPEEYQEQLGTVLTDHNHSFAFQTSELCHPNLVKHVIDTQGQGPIRQRAYRFSPYQKEVAQEIIGEFLRNKIIQPSLSPWAVPIVLVKKKTGEIRFCVDYVKNRLEP